MVVMVMGVRSVLHTLMVKDHNTFCQKKLNFEEN